MATRPPLVYRPDLGHPGKPGPGDTLDPAYLPATGMSENDRALVYFLATSR